MIIYRDKAFGFYEIFNEENGTLIRSDANGADPIMRSFPELLDVGVMGHCESAGYCKDAGVDCYQKGFESDAQHMTVGDFEKIARQATGKTFQIALGGAGDPNKHPEFEELLKICKYYRIVPNITTSGFLMSEREIEITKKYCGAVAVSWYSRLKNGAESNLETIEAIKRLLRAGCMTNIHYVISKDTIDEAILRLEQNLFPDGINAVIFILYKPVGNGIERKTLRGTDPRLERFFSLVTERPRSYRIGFDTCFTPAILRWGKEIALASLDACEAATFSMYIDSRMNCYPCSFGLWGENISESMCNKTIREIWRGRIFAAFRERKKEKCTACTSREFCLGGCRLGLGIDLCQ